LQKQLAQIRVLLVTVLVVSIVVLGFTRFGRRIGGAVARPFSAAWRVCAEVGGELWVRLFPESRSGRDALERELRESQVRLFSQAELEEENRQLRMLLHVEPPPAWRGIVAAVQSRDPARWNLEFIINRGSADGVAEGSPVLFGAFMAGRVVEVNRHTSKVATLGNGLCRMGVVVRHGKTEYNGIYQGASSPLDEAGFRSRVEFLPKEAIVSEGDGVFTAGYGEKLPPGLPVGTVAKQSPCPEVVDNARARVFVKPGEPLVRVRFVVVLVRSEPPKHE
jgi:rod shape-determining protein MreC